MRHATIPPMPADVAEAFNAYPPAIRARLMAARRLIFRTAASIEGVGPLEETLKWGEPAYLTAHKTGSTIRLGWKPSVPESYALYFHCGTTLIGSFRTLFADQFSFEGNRALLLSISDALPEKPLAICFAMALTYHRDKRVH
jgi:Domain of unknown function (DU1801)